MIKLDEQSLNSVVGGSPTFSNHTNEPEDTTGEEFMEGLCKFPKRTYKTVSNIITGKNSKKSRRYTPCERTGEAVGLAFMAMATIGLWEMAKFTLE